MRRNKSLGLLLAIGTLLLVAWQTGTLSLLTDIESLQVWIGELGVLGYAVYFLIYCAACVLAIPGSALTVGAGILFGPVKGGLLALLGSACGATLAFLVARFLLRDILERRFAGNPLFDKIDRGVADNGASFLILTRLVPVFPFNMQNFAYGLTSLRVGLYFWLTLLTMAPITFTFAYLAGDIAVNGVSFAIMVKLGVAGVILSAVAQLPKYIAKRRGISLQELEAEQ